MRSSAFMLLLLLPISLTYAEDVSEEAVGPKLSAIPAEEPEHPPAKSVSTAYAWAVGGTIIGAPLLGIGLIVGPSLGQYYAGSPNQASMGIMIRLSAIPIGLLVGGIVASASNSRSDDDGLTSGLNALDGLAGAAIAGGIVLALGTVYSLVDTKFAVDRANERARKEFRSRMGFSPMLYPTYDGRYVPGLAARVSF